MSVETALLVVASSVSLVWWIPQLWRVFHRGSVGVSVETWTVSTANLFLWGLWALTAGQVAVAIVEWIQAAGSAAVVIKVGPTRRAAWFAGGVLVVVIVAQLWPTAASLAAVGSVAVVRVPQLVRLLRDRRSGTPTQVSRIAWGMSALSNILWLAWGVAGGHMTMIVGAALSVALSGAIAAIFTRQPGRVAT